MKKSMFITTLAMGILCIILIIIAYNKNIHLPGFIEAYKTGIKVMPLIFCALIVHGMLNNLIPHDMIRNLAGEKTGIKGILLGALAGIITPGGTFVAFPFAGSLLKFGASIGAVVAYTTAYSIFDISRMPIEISFLGWKFVLIK